MNAKGLPDNILNLMKPEDRKALGEWGKTTEEALAKTAIKDEADLQAGLIGLLECRGVREVTVSRMDKRTTTKNGTPDLMATYKGIPIKWEAKLPKKNPRQDQADVLHGMTRDGAKTAVVRSMAEGILILDYLDNFLSVLGAQFEEAMQGAFFCTAKGKVTPLTAEEAKLHNDFAEMSSRTR